MSLRRALGIRAFGDRWGVQTLNKGVLEAKYAVRGEVINKADEYKERLSRGDWLPFDKLTPLNIGNPLVFEQPPLTFNRSVISLVTDPSLINLVRGKYAPDIIERAEHLISQIPGNIGAYSDSAGIPSIRKSVANFIDRRDGVRGKANPVNHNNIYLTGGASQAVMMILNTIIKDPTDGVMVPIPQYPLYSAAISLFGGQQVDYMMKSQDERWVLDADNMKESIIKAKIQGTNVRCIVVINPGNPAGNVLSYENGLEILKIAEEEDIMVIADEVYQANVYTPEKPFVSLRKIAIENQMKNRIISLHSASKGYTGECGLRGGYMHMRNIPAVLKENIIKLASIGLCSSTIGQVAMDLIAQPPQEGDPSYELYTSEVEERHSSYVRKAGMLYEEMNSMTNIQCNIVEGSMYGFPDVKLSQKVINAASEKGVAPDLYYCLQALEETGVIVVPGSGFGQEEGTWHFRTTILPGEDELREVLGRFSEFNEKFQTAHN